jgi:hypothetical protein
MVRVRPQNESRSGSYPSRGVFRSNNGTQTAVDISFGQDSYSQVTQSFRTAGGQNEDRIFTPDRSSYYAYLAEHVDRKYDTGHSFFTERKEVLHSHKNVTVRGTGQVRWTGPLVMNYIPSETQIPVPSWNPDTVGAQLIRRAIPTNPLNNVATTLGELIQPGGLPRAYTKEILNSTFKLGDKTRNIATQVKTGVREAAGGALNVQFGYLPLVSDLQGAAGAIKYGAEYIRQLERDSGKLIRRQRSAQPIATYASAQKASGVSLAALGYSANADRASLYRSQAESVGNVSVEETTSQQMWFSGGFEYVFKNAESTDNAIEYLLSRVDKLAGVSLTPDRLYQLTPFSWLVDWNSTLGDVIANAQRFSEDGLIMRYGYVMRKTVTIRTYTLSGIRFKQFDPGNITTTYRTVRKERERGNPFGMGSTAGYNARQWGLLSEVGMTQGTGTTLRRR